MATVVSEDFESGTSDGQTITTSNTTFDTVSGALEFDSGAAIDGTYSGMVNEQTAIAECRWDFTAADDLWFRGYFICETPADAAPDGFMLIHTKGISGEWRWRVWVAPTGALKFEVHNGATWGALGTTSTSWANGSSLFRVEAKGDSTGGTAICYVYGGSNAHGTTPDDTLSGTWTGGGTIDQLRVGMSTATQSTAVTLLMDALVIDDASNPGPLSTVGNATYDLTVTYATDSYAAADATYEIDATSSVGTVTLTQTGGSTVSITESPTGVFTFDDPGTGGALSFDLDAEGSTSTDTETITIQRGASGRPAVLVLKPGGTATDINDWG